MNMSISPFPILDMICPRCNYKFKYNTLNLNDIKTECPKCHLPFLHTIYWNGWYISDYGLIIWSEKYEDGEWRLPKGDYEYD